MTTPVRQRTIVISGFGGGYEDACQRMLWRGVAYLAEHKPPLDIWKGSGAYPGIYGVFHVEAAGLKGLEDAVMRGEMDATGAMHQAVMSHLRYIHEHGVEAWLEEAKQHREPEDFFDWEGAL